MLKKILITVAVFLGVTAHANNKDANLPLCPDIATVKSTQYVGVDLSSGGLFSSDYIVYSDYKKINGRPWIIVDGYIGGSNKTVAMKKAKEALNSKVGPPTQETSEQNVQWYYCTYYFKSGWYSDRWVNAYSPRSYIGVSASPFDAINAFKQSVRHSNTAN